MHMLSRADTTDEINPLIITESRRCSSASVEDSGRTSPHSVASSYHESLPETSDAARIPSEAAYQLVLQQVLCKHCSNTISIEARKRQQHVVRCNRCHEATPLRPPPPGKKYVRCPCGCLLICKITSTRIACPRSNCKRVISLGMSNPVGHATSAPVGTCRVSCAHCSEIFMFNKYANSLARCPHCRKRSSVGARFARSRAVIFLIMGLIFLLFTVGVMAGTWKVTVDHNYVGFYVLWSVLLLVVLTFVLRSLYFAAQKISAVEGPL